VRPERDQHERTRALGDHAVLGGAVGGGFMAGYTVMF